MSVRLKKGVDPTGISPEILLALIIAIPIFRKYNSDVVITALRDGKHSKHSRHYSGDAEDFRIWYLAVSNRPKVEQELQKALGPHYFVRLEKDHLHVAYKPIYQGGD